MKTSEHTQKGGLVKKLACLIFLWMLFGMYHTAHTVITHINDWREFAGLVEDAWNFNWGSHQKQSPLIAMNSGWDADWDSSPTPYDTQWGYDEGWNTEWGYDEG